MFVRACLSEKLIDWATFFCVNVFQTWEKLFHCFANLVCLIAKRHEFFSSTHQSLRKDNNSDDRILSVERGPKSSNLKGCNQAILEVNQCSQQICTLTSALGSFTLDWRDAMEHYLARMPNLCSYTLLLPQGLNHHGDGSGRRLRSLWFHFH